MKQYLSYFLLFLVACTAQAQQRIKVSELPTAVSVSSGDHVVLNSGTTTSKATVGQILASTQPLNANLTGLSSISTDGVIYRSGTNILAVGGTNGALVFTGTGPVVRSLAISDITNLQTTLDGKVGYFNHLAMAYVASNGNDATAQPGEPSRPYLTINAALDALPSTGGYIFLYDGRYNAPSTAKMKDYVSFIGRRMPKINSAQTALENGTGTIIQGSWNIGNGRKGYVIENVGIDVGQTWCAANNGGVQADGISVDNPGVLGGVTGLRMTNVLVLGQPGNGVGHCISLQDVEGGRLENVTTWYGAHGIAFKGQNSNLSNLNVHGSRLSGLILKSGDSTLKCENNNVSNVVGTAQTFSGTTFNASAIILNGVDGVNPLINTNIVNVNTKGVPGVRFDIAALDGIRDTTLANITADGADAFFFNISGTFVTRGVLAVNCVSTGTSNQGFAIQSVQDATFINCRASSKTTAAFLISGTLNSNIRIGGASATNSARAFWNLGSGDVLFLDPPNLAGNTTNFTASSTGRWLGLAMVNEQAVTQAGGTTTINLMNALQTRFTATSNTTLALQNAMPGNTYTLTITQASGTTPFTINGPTGSKFANGGTNHVMSGTNTIDVLTVRYFTGTIPLISLEKSFTP